MRDKLVTKKFISSYTPCLFDEGTESTLFHNEEYLLKFIKKEFLNSDREQIIRKLDSLSHPNIVTPEFLLHDKTRFLGYGMNYYKDYKYIDSILTNSLFTENKNYPFNKRKEIILMLCSIFDYFKTTDYSFHDIHGKNILYGNNEIKLIDLDGGVFKGNIIDTIDYHVSYIFSSKQLALFSLAFLYNMDYKTFKMAFNHTSSSLYYNRNELLRILPYKLQEFYEFALIYQNGIFNDTTECIDSINQSLYEDTLQILKKRL